MTEILGSTEPQASASDAPDGQASLAWEDPPRGQTLAASPVLTVDGFEGPLDWLLELARGRKIDLARLSILALVEAFAGAMDAALRRAPGGPAPDLERWAAWTVMAAQLTELRSRLLLPADTQEARTALAEAEALRRQWVLRTEMAAAADWFEQRPQLGLDVFARARPHVGRQGAGPARSQAAAETDDDLTDGAEAITGHAEDLPVAGGDITDLLRACLVALRLPPHADTYQPRRLPFWSINDASNRLTRLLARWPEGAHLGAFLPEIAKVGDRALHARAAVAATLVAALELSRSSALTLQQEVPWQAILVHRHLGGSLGTPPEATERGERLLA